MKKKVVILFPILLLAVTAAFPQGRGGGQGRGSGAGAGQGQGPGLGQQQSGVQTRQSEGDHKRVGVTRQQRDQIRACDKIADGIRKQAREMAQNTGSKFNADQARRQRDQIRTQVQEMEQEHERLMNGLDATQQQAFQDQIRNMNRMREQLNLQLQQTDAELSPPNPDPKRVTERAREMEQIMKEWRKHYNTLALHAAD